MCGSPYIEADKPTPGVGGGGEGGGGDGVGADYVHIQLSNDIVPPLQPGSLL